EVKGAALAMSGRHRKIKARRWRATISFLEIQKGAMLAQRLQRVSRNIPKSVFHESDNPEVRHKAIWACRKT
ncbi:TPA: hypothetical protein ACRMUR_001746, partial [Pseudomonas aeruginosa]